MCNNQSNIKQQIANNGKKPRVTRYSILGIFLENFLFCILQQSFSKEFVKVYERKNDKWGTRFNKS